MPDKYEIIIDFVNENPGCNKEFIVKGLINDLSRGTIFKTIEELKDSKRIEEKTDVGNRRDKKLYVISEHPLNSLQKCLDDFDKNYFSFLKELLNNFRIDYHEHGDENFNEFFRAGKRYDYITSIFYDVTKLFVKMLKGVLNYVLVKIPTTMKDKDSFYKNDWMIWKKISEMYQKFDKTLRRSDLPIATDALNKVNLELWDKQQDYLTGANYFYEGLVDNASNFGYQKKVERIIINPLFMPHAMFSL